MLETCSNHARTLLAKHVKCFAIYRLIIVTQIAVSVIRAHFTMDIYALFCNAIRVTLIS